MSISKKKNWHDAEDRRLNRYRPTRYQPAWATVFKDPLRLERYRYGINLNMNVNTLAGAQAEWPAAKIADVASKGFDHAIYSFGIEDVASTAGLPSAGFLQALETMVRSFQANGMALILGIYTNGALNRDIHGQTSTGWSLASLTSFWQNLYRSLAGKAWFDPQKVAFKLWNEAGNYVEASRWSMASYNGWLAQLIPALRATEASLTNKRFTYFVDFYPLGAVNHFTYGGTDLSLPLDYWTVADVHDYDPGPYVNQGAFPWDNGPAGVYYLRGVFKWGMTRAEAGAALQTYTCDGLFGVDPLATAQIQYWRDNWATEIDPLGFTDAYKQSRYAAIAAWAKTAMAGQGVPVFMSEFEVPAAWHTSVHALSEAELAKCYGAILRAAAAYGIYGAEWLYEEMSNNPASHLGDERLNDTVLQRNPLRLTKQAGRGIFA